MLHDLQQAIAVELGGEAHVDAFLLQRLEETLGGIDFHALPVWDVAVLVVALGFHYQVHGLGLVALQQRVAEVGVVVACRCWNVHLGQLGKHGNALRLGFVHRVALDLAVHRHLPLVVQRLGPHRRIGDGVHFCAPVGHRQEDGDYRESWQPQQMSDLALERAQAIAREVVLALGGYGLFGVELFVCGDEVIFSEVSPRPHDTGMVTLISQDLSEFALHVRAFLGLPVGAIRQYGPAASAVILPQLSSQNVSFGQLQSAVGAGLQLRLFGKPEIDGTRRLGVTLAVADSVEEAVARAKTAAAAVIVEG